MKISGPFRFKKFAVEHDSSSMKVGVDAVLLGAWGNVEGKKGLDIGCGCGVIALMAAQRNSDALIDGIDIHAPSIEEADRNFRNSPWSARLKATLFDASTLATEDNEACRLYGERYDFILSNPPFFNSGVSNPVTPREKARHEASLSPAVLLKIGEKILKDKGTLSVILPYNPQAENGIDGYMMQSEFLHLERVCIVGDREGKTPKRLLLSYRKDATANGTPSVESLFIRNQDGTYSRDYINLTREFYLAF